DQEMKLKAGDLFLVEDNVVVKNLLVIVENIHKIIGQAGYVSNDNDQSIVEITVTRITSAIRETGLVVEHAAALVTLLESCLRHDLKPTARGEDPPHAKIASDIISCLFLNYSQKEVMRLALPVAVKFLHKGNKELSRNMSSYLSLAAMENADLLSNCVQLIIDSVNLLQFYDENNIFVQPKDNCLFFVGNYALSRVLPQIYAVDWERIHDHVMALVSLLPLCDTHEKLALLSLFQLIAEKKPNLLEPSLSQLWECLSFPSCLHPTLGIFIHMANARPQPFVDYVTRLEAVALKDRSTLPSVIKIIGPVGRMNKDRAGEAIPYLLSQLPQMEAGKLSIPLKELVSICDAHPSLLTEKILKEVGMHHSTSKLVTSGPSTGTGAGGYMYKSLSVLGGRSLGIGILKTASSSNKSMRFGICSILSACLFYEKSRTLDETLKVPAIPYSGSMNMSVFRNEDVAPASLPNPVSPGAQVSPPPIQSQQGHPVSLSLCLSGGTSPLSMASNHRLPSVSGNQGVTPIYPWPQPSSPPMTRPSTTGEVTILKTHQSGSSNPPSQMAGVTYRKGSTSVTISSKMPSTPTSTGAQRISVFEPYPMRDAVYHFCEKHLEKIKIYMETVFVTLPLPVRCTIEERKNRKHAKLYFACQGKGEHCLYNRTFFTMKTRQPRIWIHLMFLALQSWFCETFTKRMMKGINHGISSPRTLVASQQATMQKLRRKEINASFSIESLMNLLVELNAQAPCVLHLPASLQYADYMVVVSAMSPRHLKSLGEEVRKELKRRLGDSKGFVPVPQIEGSNSSDWVALDLGNIVLHMFLEPIRRHYDIETLWAARSSTALSTRESSVSSLKNCWDTLKCENKAFVTLVTSAFPSGRVSCHKSFFGSSESLETVTKDEFCFPSQEQELLIHELRGIRYFDVFEYNAMAGQWGCFLCNHPDRATGFLQPDQPVIEGQLKEKKGKWRLFKRWRMRYFTLSAGHLSYRGVGSSKSDKELVPIELNQIRSVKTISRGGRHLPKAFEIFTDDCSFVLKPQDGKNAEEWVQCLSIALAHTHAKGNHSRTLSAFGSGSLR
ncbi:unnamed protein product, partial [Darwinula stevensoni]